MSAAARAHERAAGDVAVTRQARAALLGSVALALLLRPAGLFGREA